MAYFYIFAIQFLLLFMHQLGRDIALIMVQICRKESILLLLLLFMHQ